MRRRRTSPVLILVVCAMSFLVVQRVWRSMSAESPSSNQGGLEMAAARALHLTPGGIYTAADVASNGHQTPYEKYRGFRARHDVRPRPGDRLCPITETLANPKCTWTVGGPEYEFCCPPCIDEFVRLAKKSPQQIREPTAYIKR